MTFFLFYPENIIQLLTIEVLDMTWYPPENTNIDWGNSLDQYWYSMVDINVICDTSVVKKIVLLYSLSFLLITVAIHVTARPHKFH